MLDKQIPHDFGFGFFNTQDVSDNNSRTKILVELKKIFKCV